MLEKRKKGKGGLEEEKKKTLHGERKRRDKERQRTGFKRGKRNSCIIQKVLTALRGGVGKEMKSMV